MADWLAPLVNSGPSTFDARVTAFRSTIGELLASPNADARWCGRCLQAWLSRGGDLQHALGLRPVRGSKRTAQSLAKRHPDDDGVGTIETSKTLID